MCVCVPPSAQDGVHLEIKEGGECDDFSDTAASSPPFENNSSALYWPLWE